MAGLHTIVCLKAIPKPEEVTVNAETRTVDRAGARSEINGPDLNALEAALALKEAHGGRVSLLSMGPPFFEPYLRLGLCMGADSAYLLSDRAFGGADTLATSYALAAGVKSIGGYDLILCGEESSDGATAQVPPGIAEWLDVPQVTYAVQLAVDTDRWVLRARRDLGAGHEDVEVPLPVVVSVKVGMNEPRFLEGARRRWAMEEAPVTVWTAADLGLDPAHLGLPGSATTVSGVAVARAATREHEFLSGSPEEEARQILDRIRPWLRLA
jgi:electron transfer flavoprotein beta subunit